MNKKLIIIVLVFFSIAYLIACEKIITNIYLELKLVKGIKNGESEYANYIYDAEITKYYIARSVMSLSLYTLLFLWNIILSIILIKKQNKTLKQSPTAL
jgi:hypothetical protein